MGLHQKWAKVQLPQKGSSEAPEIPHVKFGRIPCYSFREKLQKCNGELKAILVYGSVPKVDQSIQLPQKSHLGPLKISLVKFGCKPHCSFREKFWKCKCDLKSNFGL